MNNDTTAIVNIGVDIKITKRLNGKNHNKMSNMRLFLTSAVVIIFKSLN